MADPRTADSFPFAGRPGRVLVVEDERRIRELVCRQLARAGYDAQGIADGRDGLHRLLAEPYDVVVLDLMLPGVDGLTICRTVRSQGVNRDVPILILTARRAEVDKVEGFIDGADDYVTKPFGIHELTARVAALARRARRPVAATASPPPRGPISISGIELDPLQHTVVVRGAPASLTPHEFELLFQLASQPGIVLTRQQLLSLVWHGEAFVTERSVDTLIRHLRCKVEVTPASPVLILTVWGYGYKFAGA
jgi:DNA-binding response OmpR family regulator